MRCSLVTTGSLAFVYLSWHRLTSDTQIETVPENEIRSKKDLRSKKICTGSLVQKIRNNTAILLFRLGVAPIDTEIEHIQPPLSSNLFLVFRAEHFLSCPQIRPTQFLQKERLKHVTQDHRMGEGGLQAKGQEHAWMYGIIVQGVQGNYTVCCDVMWYDTVY